MTFAYYKRIFLKTSVNEDDRRLAEIERSFAATESFNNKEDYRLYTLAHYDFDSINSSVIDPSKLDTGTVPFFKNIPASFLMKIHITRPSKSSIEISYQRTVITSGLK